MTEKKTGPGRPKKYKDNVNAQTEANKAWAEKNRDRARYLRNRSAARSFLGKQATLEDLEEMQSLIDKRRATFKS